MATNGPAAWTSAHCGMPAPAIAASPIFPMACRFFSASFSTLNDLEVGIAWVLVARDVEKQETND